MSVLPVGFGASGGYEISNSLRLRASASAYLSRTFGTPTTQDTFTFSAWVKRSKLGSLQNLLGVSTNTSIGFPAADTLVVTCAGSATITTSGLYRDPSAWCHVQYKQTTGAATLYFNGVSVGSSATVSAVFNTAVAHQLGAANTSNYTDGYLSDVYFVDGQALTPSSFGETDSNGVWVSKPYTGTYGTNGFHLDFKDAALTAGSNAGLGKDVSGNGNYWTTNNISVTSGVTYDSFIDTPTNNFATMNPIVPVNGVTLTDGNLTSSMTAAGTIDPRGTIAVSSGKWYWEITKTDAIAAGHNFGIIDVAQAATINNFTGSNSVGYYSSNGNRYLNGTSAAYGTSYTTNDVIGVELDLDSGTQTVRFYKNNTVQNAGAYINLTSGLTWVPTDSNGGGGTVTAGWNFGQRPFAYTPPTGFKALCTANLPAVAITKPTEHHSVHTVTKSGDTAFTLPWNADTYDTLFEIKRRDAAGGWYRLDGVRGYTKVLFCNTTAAETTDANVLGVSGTTCTLKSTLTDGTYVVRAWKAGPSASRSTNTDGSMTTTVSNNATAGFSICTYTSPGSAADQTFGHGLGLVPSFAEIKNLDSANNWDIFHTSQGYNNTFIYDTAATRSGALGSTINTTIFTTKTTYTHNSTNRYVAYAWAEIAGYSAFKQYVGNGAADGPFQWLGFRPASQVVKYGGIERFHQLDVKRDTYNVQQNVISPNATTSEGTGLLNTDATAGGLKVRSVVYGNTSSGNHVVAAFAEFPFGGSNCRPSPAR